MTTNLRIVITGGGTGGHFFPAKAIWKKLEENGAEIKYIGSKFGIEAQKLKYNKNILLLNIKGIQRDLSATSILKNMIFPFRFIISYYRSRNFLNRFKPHLVIGTGGYSSGLPLLAAIHKGIKTIIHEQNSFPGITTRHLASRVTKVCVSYSNMDRYIKTKNIIFTGNPIRENIQKIIQKDAKKIFNCDINLPVVTILGGSQGSVPINNHFVKNFSKYTNSNIQIIWQCGTLHYNYLKNTINQDKIKLYPFINNMSALYSASDLVISRSGALVLSEMALMKKAMILIPLPKSANNHQKLNAKTFSDLGAAIIINQHDLNSEILENTVLNLLKQKSKIKKMEDNSGKLAIPNATEKIFNEIFKMVSI